MSHNLVPMPVQLQDIHSDEVQDIMGNIPHWLIRWGNLVVFIVILSIALCAYIVHYPDLLIAQGLINAREQPQKITWFITDPNVKYELRVVDGQQVTMGDTLLLEIYGNRKITNFIKAKVSGQTFLLKGVDNNPKASMLLVVPIVTNYEVQLKLPLKGAGQVRVGQRVLIKLDAFPSSEFGFLEGNVSGIVPVSMDNHYRANVTLKNKLVTNSGHVLPIQPLLQGTAEVMLDDKRLIERIFATIL